METNRAPAGCGCWNNHGMKPSSNKKRSNVVMIMRFSKPVLVLMVLFLFSCSSAAADSWSQQFRNWVVDVPTAKQQPLKYTSQMQASVPASAACMGCHTGHGMQGARQVTVKSGNTPMHFQANGRQKDHPVGMDYASYARRYPNQYKPLQQLNPSIVLEAGSVTCVSCHQSRAPETAFTSHAGDWMTVRADPQGRREMYQDSACTAAKTYTVPGLQTDLCLSCHTM